MDNTERKPFFSMSLDETRIDRIDSGGALWGRCKEPRHSFFEDAGQNLEAGRDLALDIALRHCSYDFGADAPAGSDVATFQSIVHQRHTNFALVNRVVVLAFQTHMKSRPKGQTSPLYAMRVNLGEALFLPNFEKESKRTVLVFENGIALDSHSSTDDADRLIDFIEELPVVTAGVQRARLATLNAAYKRAGRPLLAENPRLSVDVSPLDNSNPALAAEAIFAAAGKSKRRDSGWLCTEPPSSAPESSLA
ncbi:MAG: hypothetical protein OXP09_06455 [Gammaproteobacteria bacterium]|nr:hypothetical protein [Gammaproteobacteria bacterium]MDE0365200.1 hypothetical protein [Gammaproteobacteria bacterium]